MRALTKIFGVAILTTMLAACGTSNTVPMSQYGYNTGYNNGYGQTGFTGGPGGCVPLQSGSFSFSAQGAQMNSAVLMAGNIPGAGQVGQVTMGGSNFNNGAMIQYQPKTGQNGTLQLTASSTNTGSGTVSGMIQLSPALISQIMAMGYQMTGYSGNYQNQYQQQSSLCVSSIAIRAAQTIISNGYNTQYGGYNPYGQMNQMGMSGGMGQINQAMVYLYLNNGTPIGPIVF